MRTKKAITTMKEHMNPPMRETTNYNERRKYWIKKGNVLGKEGMLGSSMDYIEECNRTNQGITVLIKIMQEISISLVKMRKTVECDVEEDREI